MRILILFLLSVLMGATAVGQQKMLTPEDAAGLNRSLIPQRLRNLGWVYGTHDFAYIENEALVRGKPGQTLRDTLLRLADLNRMLEPHTSKALKRFPGIQWVAGPMMVFHHDNVYYAYSLLNKNLIRKAVYPENAARFSPDPNNTSLAYTVENNLFIASQEGMHEVTKDSDKGIVNGQEVHRNEFGIDGGIFWSPDGNKLAFYRMDERMVSEYPLVNIDTRIASLTTARYPMAGEVSHEVSLGVYDLNQRKTIFLEIEGPKDQYLTCITWSPDGTAIYAGILNRDQNHLVLNQYNALTGKYVKTILEEKHPKYVEPMHSLYFVPGRNDQFIWMSERDGYNHLYLYNTKGELLRQLTQGPWVVKDLLGFSPDGKTAWYTATAQGPLETHAYGVELRNGRSSRLTYAAGTHAVSMAFDGRYLIDIYSSIMVAGETLLLDGKGNLVEILVENKDPLEEYNLGETKLFTLKAEDGTDLHCRMILPPQMDESRKYPVFIYVYGGPHAQLITNSWLAGAGLFLNYMAQQGFVVFTLDNRGSANRGKAFEQAIFRNLGDVEVQDQMTGVAYLKNLPYVDAGRIGVNGWSYGGFMTMSMMLKNPGVFKVGCAGGPVTDWKYYEVMYGERYMDTPQDNPEGYAASSLLNKAGQLEGRLLVIHGTMDATVVWQHSLDFIKKCVDAGKQVDYFVYPGHEHNVRGKDRAHLNRKIAEYFQTFL